MTMTDRELYEGFTPEQIERYRREARERYDPALVQESERRVRKMSRQQWQALKQEGDEVARLLASLMDRSLGDAAVLDRVERKGLSRGR